MLSIPIREAPKSSPAPALRGAEATISEPHADQIHRLYRLAQQLLAMEPEAAQGERLLQVFAGEFGARSLCIFDAETAKSHAWGHSRNHLPECTLAAFIQEQDSDSPVSQVSVRLLRANGKITGAMGFEGLEDPQRLATHLADLAGAALERTRAFERASESAAAARAEVYRLAVLNALAHEFKDPLAIIVAAAGGIRETGSLRAPQLEMTETVEAEALRLGNLTTRLLRVAWLDREQVKPEPEVIDVVGLVSSVVNEYRRMPLDRCLGPVHSEEPLEALADPELLRLALSQLLDNACKYSLPGSDIAVTLESQGNTIYIRVANSGSTIPEGEQSRIFERFYRGEGARRFTTGSGLGLYIARKIAVAHGGQLDLDIFSSGESSGEGVTFSLTLPKVNHRIEPPLQNPLET